MSDLNLYFDNSKFMFNRVNNQFKRTSKQAAAVELDLYYLYIHKYQKFQIYLLLKK